MGKILLVDDEDEVRKVTSMMLELLGYSVVSARDGADALEKLQEHKHDISLVLMDLSMPVMDGEETFIEMRKKDKNIPVIIATGHSDTATTDRISSLNVDGIVNKPYLMDELVEVIESKKREINQ